MRFPGIRFWRSHRNLCISFIPTFASERLKGWTDRAMFRMRHPCTGAFRAVRAFVDHGVLPPDFTALDIGANRGKSAAAIRMFAPHAHIVSFEPNATLERHLRGKGRYLGAFEYRMFGLGDETERRTLYVPVYRRMRLTSLSSFSYHDVERWFTTDSSLIPAWDRGAIRIERRVCAIRTLDQIVDDLRIEPHFIKVDARAWEMRVIRGGQRTIGEYRPVLMTANTDLVPEIENYLCRYDYAAETWGGNGFADGTTYGSDRTFFIPAEKLPLLPRAHA